MSESDPTAPPVVPTSVQVSSQFQNMHQSASQVTSSRSFNHDYFGFCILLPDKNPNSNTDLSGQPSASSVSTTPSAFDEYTLRVEFAICYEWDHGAHSSWDNNAGDNYKFQCFYNK